MVVNLLKQPYVYSTHPAQNHTAEIYGKQRNAQALLVTCLGRHTRESQLQLDWDTIKLSDACGG